MNRRQTPGRGLHVAFAAAPAAASLAAAARPQAMKVIVGFAPGGRTRRCRPFARTRQ